MNDNDDRWFRFPGCVSFFFVAIILPCAVIPIVVITCVIAARNPEASRAGAATVFGALAIYLVAGWLNQRDDPRHKKRPPDAP
jgi:hypothetical protein